MFVCYCNVLFVDVATFKETLTGFVNTRYGCAVHASSDKWLFVGAYQWPLITKRGRVHVYELVDGLQNSIY